MASVDPDGHGVVMVRRTPSPPVAPTGGPAAPMTAWSLASLTVTVIVGHSVLVAIGVGELVTLVVNVVVASSLVALARRERVTSGDLGLVVPGRFWPAAAAAAVVLVVVLGAAGFGLLPDDTSAAALTPVDVWFRALIAIPIGTALCEEVVFRGVLLAAWDRALGRRWSAAVVSVAFGLWHVAAEAQRTGGLGPAVVPGAVATAAVSAFVLGPLRRRTGSLVAPVAVHAAANVSVFVAVVVASG